MRRIDNLPVLSRGQGQGGIVITFQYYPVDTGRVALFLSPHLNAQAQFKTKFAADHPPSKPTTMN